jgi:hypothetical protein
MGSDTPYQPSLLRLPRVIFQALLYINRLPIIAAVDRVVVAIVVVINIPVSPRASFPDIPILTLIATFAGSLARSLARSLSRVAVTPVVVILLRSILRRPVRPIAFPVTLSASSNRFDERSHQLISCFLQRGEIRDCRFAHMFKSLAENDIFDKLGEIEQVQRIST